MSDSSQAPSPSYPVKRTGETLPIRLNFISAMLLRCFLGCGIGYPCKIHADMPQLLGDMPD